MSARQNPDWELGSEATEALEASTKFYFNANCTLFLLFLNCCVAAPWLTLCHYWGDSLIHLMLINAFYRFRPEGHRKLTKGTSQVSKGKFRLLFLLNPAPFIFMKESSQRQISFYKVVLACCSQLLSIWKAWRCYSFRYGKHSKSYAALLQSW